MYTLSSEDRLLIVRLLCVRVWGKLRKTLRHQHCVCYNRLAHLCETGLPNVLFFLQLTRWLVKVWEEVQKNNFIHVCWSCSKPWDMPSKCSHTEWDIKSCLPPVRYWALGVVSRSRRREYPQGCCHWDNQRAKCGSSGPCDSVSVQINALHKAPTHSL